MNPAARQCNHHDSPRILPLLARIFIDRPILAWVISIVIVLFGIAAVFVLPVAQYPDITPPSVQVTASYPGANSEVVQNTVAAPIEQQVNGVEGMMYMSSTSASDGSYTLTVTFELGVDLNIAQVLVQNRVAQAMPTLPPEVQAVGVTTKKLSPAILLVVNLYSDDNPATKKPFYDQLYLSNYATTEVLDELSRIKGVGSISLLGQQDYSMRVWLDPEKLASRKMTANDVISALKEQNAQVAAGQFGKPPVPTGQDFQYVLSTLGRLDTKEQFENIVLRTGEEGGLAYLRDVGRVELGARQIQTISRLDGRPSAGLACFQLPGSNALDVGNKIKAKMRELRERFPPGLRDTIVYDTTPFIEESVHEVFKTLVEAIILVVIVVLVFLQDWKAVMLPLIDVIVSLVGTCAILFMMGFSLNNLTLFGLVLAIGIVVDDAIVVLENIERWIGMGHKVRDATIHAMDEITGPIIGITLVLSSVFLPSAMLPGITGQFYRQFALTIAVSMIISAINAMTMTPARAASVFKDPKPGESHEHHKEALPWWGVAALGGAVAMQIPYAVGYVLSFFPSIDSSALKDPVLLSRLLFVPGAIVGWLAYPLVNRVLGGFFRGFNRFFDAITHAYGVFISRLLRIAAIVMLLYVGLLGLTVYGFTHVPTGFIPSQDQGYLVTDAQLPDAASLERTEELVAQLEKIALETPGVGHTVAVPGQSFVLNSFGSNFAGMFVVLKPFHDRHFPEEGAEAVLAKLRKRFSEEVPDARVSIFGAPPIQGLGNTGGFKYMIQARAGASLDKLQAVGDNVAEKANATPGLVGVFNIFRANTPQIFVDIDRDKCKSQDVAISDVNLALQTFLGGYYVNDFNILGRTWQVNVQAEAKFRLGPESFTQMFVRSKAGKMVPLATLLVVRDDVGPVVINRYNMYPAAAISGGSKPGVSSGTVIKLMENIAREELPREMSAEWTEVTYLQIQAGSSAIFAFLGAVILVYFVLCGLYESWSLPLAVILVVPMCLLSAIIGVVIARMDINIFVQIGFVVLVGLASKNAILVVEFARDEQKKGKSLVDAVLEACRARLRPIIMTSFAFILGVVPLMLGHGAGSEMRATLGVAVFSGMLGVTMFGLVLTPVFYYVIIGIMGNPDGATPPPAAPPPPHVPDMSIEPHR
jgi:multidrug efflux pump